MGRVRCRSVVAVSLLLVSYEAVALPFISLDARANAMGGAGVAASRSVNAAFVNPALLLRGQPQEDILVPVVGLLRLSDPKNLQDEIGRYQDDNLEALFETALARYQDDPTLPSSVNGIGAATRNLTSQLARFSGRPLEEELAAGFAVNLPGRRMALVVAQQTIGGGRVAGVAEDLAAYDELLKATDPGDDAFKIVVSGPGRTLKSRLQARGAVIREFGLALAREVQVGGHKVMAGITPKYVDVTTFGYEAPISSASYRTDIGQRQQASFNVDLGLTKEYGKGWSSGAAIKNLIPYDYKTAQSQGRVTIQPQARAGVAYDGEWYAVALDLDLNQSRAAGIGYTTQYLALGGELELSKTLQLRAGYRHNLADSSTSVVTTGLGFTLLGALADVALNLNRDEIGLSAQLGLNF